jgi:hypothetical protein
MLFSSSPRLCVHVTGGGDHAIRGQLRRALGYSCQDDQACITVELAKGSRVQFVLSGGGSHAQVAVRP